jgi:hypothetical protein
VLRELEVAPSFEADEDDALAVLRHHALGLHDFVMEGVAEFPGPCASGVAPEVPFACDADPGWLNRRQ